MTGRNEARDEALHTLRTDLQTLSDRCAATAGQPSTSRLITETRRIANDAASLLYHLGRFEALQEIDR